MQRLLESLGFRAASFASAMQFVASPERDETACLILDVRMPEIGGLALYDRLCATGWRVPTIFVTALPSLDERNRVMAKGAAAYLAKPLTEEILLDTIHDALAVSNKNTRDSFSGEIARGTSTQGM